jgi:hypothetical protein
LILIVFYGFEKLWSQNARQPVTPCGPLWPPVPPCAALWQRIGSPIRNISGGLEEVADRWEEGIGRTQDIEDFLEGLRT